jgi:hypothetical protein
MSARIAVELENIGMALVQRFHCTGPLGGHQNQTHIEKLFEVIGIAGADEYTAFRCRINCCY